MGELLLVLGCFVIFTGALGFYRFHDSLQRFHPATKISVLGLGLVILGEGIDFGVRTGDWQIRALIAVPLLVICSPWIAHLLALGKLDKN